MVCNHHCNNRLICFDNEEGDNGDDYDYDGSRGDHQYSVTDRPLVKNDGTCEGMMIWMAILMKIRGSFRISIMIDELKIPQYC